MEHNHRSLGGNLAVFADKQVATNNLDIRRSLMGFLDGSQFRTIARGTDETAQVPESAFKQVLHDFRSDKTCRASYKDAILRARDHVLAASARAGIRSGFSKWIGGHTLESLAERIF
jgi:hypothetical protein